MTDASREICSGKTYTVSVDVHEVSNVVAVRAVDDGSQWLCRTLGGSESDTLVTLPASALKPVSLSECGQTQSAMDGIERKNKADAVGNGGSLDAKGAIVVSRNLDETLTLSQRQKTIRISRQQFESVAEFLRSNPEDCRCVGPTCFEDHVGDVVIRFFSLDKSFTISQGNVTLDGVESIQESVEEQRTVD